MSVRTVSPAASFSDLTRNKTYYVRTASYHTKNGNKVCIAVSGKIDTTNAHQFEAAVKELIEGASELTFDMNGLEYISSAGLRQIVAAYKKMKGALTLRHVSDEIMNVISMTGLDKRMKFE